MTNRVPPLHPASPPPFNKLSFYEDDVDENDDFASYTIVTPDVEEKFYRDSPETIENSENRVNEDIVFSSSLTVDTAVVEDVPTTSHQKDVSTTKVDVGLTESKNETTVGDETRSAGVDESPMTHDDSTSINNDHVDDVLVIENDTRNDHFNTDDRTDLESGENNTVIKADAVLENFPEVPSYKPINESIPFEICEKNDTVVESSDDSSAVINEAAFIVIENGSDIEEDILDDDFQEFSGYKTDSGEGVISERSNTLPPLTETDQQQTKSGSEDDPFLSTILKQAEGANRQVFDSPTEAVLVTADDCQVPESHQTLELSTEYDHVEVVDENDDFDDFVSPPLYETHSTEPEPLTSERVDESRRLSTKEPTSNAYTVDCWNEIFEYSCEEPIEVNLNTLEGKLSGSSIWCQIKNIETSPALKFNWNESETKELLLATLGVDLRNILFGPRWNSEVPRFASNLKFSPLVPQKASSDDTFESQHSDPGLAGPTEGVNEETVSQTSSGVRDAHFDWTGSGLTNPLDARKPDKVAEVTTVTVSQLEYDLPAAIENLTSDRGLSAEATKILNSLPDLVVMEKQYIVFPIR